MKRAMIKALIPELVAHKAEITVSAIGSNSAAALGKAFRKLLIHPDVAGKHISTIKATISFTAINMQAVEAVLAKDEGGTDQ